MRQATQQEYQRVVDRMGLEVRRVSGNRFASVYWSNRGTPVAEKTDHITRGKVVSTQYLVNPEALVEADHSIMCEPGEACNCHGGQTWC